MPEDTIGTLVILAITVAASLVGFAVPGVLQKCVLRPYQVVRGQNWDSLYLSGFMHADFGHLFFNMFSFYFFAPALERRIGTLPFVIGYVLSLVGSMLPSLARHRDDPNYATLGASGGVTAVIFAYIILYPTRTLYLLLLPVPIPALLYAAAYLAYSIYSARRATGRTNHEAHIAGAVCGMIWIGVCVPGAHASLLSHWL
jgi:membrane associated rhomboid family serine protease